ncbi:hypothetical protein N1851_034009 [Merluccius polli]|uniref:Reverse transcriptase n=1 Tax=Merluccius polli TaxID=89951 RepID=A0AA47M0B9_MERPO|nr:hypothetical protein N1851_034009 [Merluccius polli]
MSSWAEEALALRQANQLGLRPQLQRGGKWMRWEGLERRKLTWTQLWEMEASNISFIIRATYDVLLSPKNLQVWYGEDPTCALCPTPATLKHILAACNTSLTQGRYTRHNQVLKSLAAAIESKRNTNNSLPESNQLHHNTHFHPRGTEKAKPSQYPASHGLGLEDATTTLRPDLVLWSPSLRSVNIIELTVPWESLTEEAYERKKLRYTELAADAQQRGWKAKVYPVEVGCRGFVAYSTIRLLKDLGIHGQALRQAARSVSEAAERSSQWIWLKRKDPCGLKDQDPSSSPSPHSSHCKTLLEEGEQEMAPVLASRPPRSFVVTSVLLLLLFAFRYVSALLAYDRQTLLDLRAWSETLLPSDRPLFDHQTPVLADIPDHLRRLPTVSPRRDRDQKSRSNGSYGSEHRRWLSCPLPQRKRSRRRGKGAVMISRPKAHPRASSSAESRLGFSPPVRLVCSR